MHVCMCEASWVFPSVSHSAYFLAVSLTAWNTHIHLDKLAYELYGSAFLSLTFPSSFLTQLFLLHSGHYFYPVNTLWTEPSTQPLERHSQQSSTNIGWLPTSSNIPKQNNKNCEFCVLAVSTPWQQGESKHPQSTTHTHTCIWLGHWIRGNKSVKSVTSCNSIRDSLQLPWRGWAPEC